MNKLEFLGPAINTLQWITTFLLLGLAWYCFERKKLKIAKALCLFFTLTAHWSFWAAVIYLVPNIETKILLNRLKLVSIPYIPLSMFFVVYALQSSFKISRKIWALLAIIPTITAVLCLTPHHELFIGGYKIYTISGYDFLAFTNGSWFQAHNVQSRILTAVSLTLLFFTATSKELRKAPKKWLIFLALFIPFFTDSLAVLYFEFLRYIQITPATLGITALIMVYSIFKDNILEVSPLARGLAFDNASDPHLVFNHNNLLSDLNKEASYIFNLSKNDLGRTEDQLFKDHPDSQNQFQKIKDRYFIKIGKELLDHKNQTIGTLLTFRDITDQYNLNLASNQIDEFKTKLLAILSHDLQSHLLSIALISEQMSNDENLTYNELRANSDHILRSTNSCVFFVEQIKLWSKSQLNLLNPEHKTFDFIEVCQEVKDFYLPMAKTKNISISIDTKHDSKIKSDPQIVKIILQNLVSNAIKFSHHNSEIKINLSRQNNNYLITVEDFGIGMDEHKLKKVLNPTADSFTGLGLFLSFDFSKRLNGTLMAKSTPHQGSVFTLVLPI